MENKQDSSDLNEFASELYADLHRIAVRHVRGERSEHTLQATALLHEAYLKLSGDRQRHFNNKTHFLAVASSVMRQVLVDYARGRGTKKRDGGIRVEAGRGDEAQPLNDLADEQNEAPEILELNGALDALAQEDESLAQLVEMRYFGGMTANETAEALGRSVHVVRHDLRLAQAWLRRHLRQNR